MNILNQIKLKPVEWSQMIGIEILDPDGWSRKDPKDFETPITFPDFQEKLLTSTVDKFVTEGTMKLLVVEKLIDILNEEIAYL